MKELLSGYSQYLRTLNYAVVKWRILSIPLDSVAKQATRTRYCLAHPRGELTLQLCISTSHRLIAPLNRHITDRHLFFQLRRAIAMSTITRFKLIFFVPPSALAACKSAIFATGAGRYPGPGQYTECCWTTLGTGQFRPGDSAKPNIGKVGELEEVQEVRVETLCMDEDVARKAVEALKR